MNTTQARPWWELVDPDLVAEYVELTHATRCLQRYQRKHLDGGSRRELGDAEARLDLRTEELRAAIFAAKELAAAEDSAELVEGGVA